MTRSGHSFCLTKEMVNLSDVPPTRIAPVALRVIINFLMRSPILSSCNQQRYPRVVHSKSLTIGCLLPMLTKASTTSINNSSTRKQLGGKTLSKPTHRPTILEICSRYLLMIRWTASWATSTFTRTSTLSETKEVCNNRSRKSILYTL